MRTRPSIKGAMVFIFLGLGAVTGGPAGAGLMGSDDGRPAAAKSPTPGFVQPANPGLGAEVLPPDTSLTLSAALRRGMWTRACNIATEALSRQQPDSDALGVFALCSAVLDHKDALEVSLKRLRESEPPPHYYATLAEGIRHLRTGALDNADAALRSVQRSHPGDALGTYFTGELLHARKKDAEAIAAFKAVLGIWPEYAPAMAASAQLMATPTASKEQLNAAVKLSERSTLIDPMNRAYWRQLADLCRRTGQDDRANAITLQWLTPSVK